MNHYSSPYYCLTRVFHDQNDDITENIALFNNLLIRNGFYAKKSSSYKSSYQKRASISGYGEKGKKKTFFTYNSICVSSSNKV